MYAPRIDFWKMENAVSFSNASLTTASAPRCQYLSRYSFSSFPGGRIKGLITFLAKPLAEQLLGDVRAVKKPTRFQDGGRHLVNPSYVEMGDVERGGHAIHRRGALLMRRYRLDILPAVEEPHVSPDPPGLVMRHECAGQRDGERETVEELDQSFGAFPFCFSREKRVETLVSFKIFCKGKSTRFLEIQRGNLSRLDWTYHPSH